MGTFKTMNKSDVRYDAKLQVAKVESLKKALIVDTILHEREVKDAIEEAKRDESLTDGYVKAGLVGKDLVFRIKGKIGGKAGHWGEADVLLVKDYKGVEKESLTRKAGVNRALDRLISDLKELVTTKLGSATKHYSAAKVALNTGDAATAAREHGTALNDLKGITYACTPSGSQKWAARMAEGEKVSVRDFHMPDATVAKKLALFKKLSVDLSKLYQDMVKETTALTTRIEALEDGFANADTQEASDNATYNAMLKEILGGYNEVLEYAKAGHTRVKTAYNKIATLARRVDALAEKDLDKMLNALELVRAGMYDNYSDVDSHIQSTIRTTESKWVKKAAIFGIKTEDKTKFLMPIMNRCFATNYECKTLCENGNDSLIAILDDLIEKFDSVVARELRGAWAASR